jgi:uncharacterized protein
MTPQEQQLVADLFDRLATLESQRRDPDAERLIREGLGRAPNAAYALVQSVLVQDEALKRASARIEELERAAAQPAPSAPSGGFLDSMRSALTGRDSRGSVPSVRPGGEGSSGVWGPRPDAAPAAQPAAQPGGQGGQWGGGSPGSQFGGPPAGGMMGGMGGGMLGGGSSFLGTAAATVAGVVGGGMLLEGIRSMMGGHQGFGGHQAFGDYERIGAGPSPWDGGNRGNDELARDAGVGDVGSSDRSANYSDSGRTGLFGDANDQPDDQGQADDDYAGGSDSGDDFDAA